MEIDHRRRQQKRSDFSKSVTGSSSGTTVVDRRHQIHSDGSKYDTVSSAGTTTEIELGMHLQKQHQLKLEYLLEKAQRKLEKYTGRTSLPVTDVIPVSDDCSRSDVLCVSSKQPSSLSMVPM